MSVYRLKYHDDGLGCAKEIEFDAPDSAQALFIAQHEARGRTAELWCDSQPVCTLRRVSNEGDYWVINRAPSVPLPARSLNGTDA